MTNVTLKLDDNLASAARILAAKRGISMSRLVASELEGLVNADQLYEQAKARALAHLSSALSINYSKPATRDELHAR